MRLLGHGLRLVLCDSMRTGPAGQAYSAPRRLHRLPANFERHSIRPPGQGGENSHRRVPLGAPTDQYAGLRQRGGTAIRFCCRSTQYTFDEMVEIRRTTVPTIGDDVSPSESPSTPEAVQSRVGEMVSALRLRPRTVADATATRAHRWRVPATPLLG